MKLSAQEEYGLRCLIRVAQHCLTGPPCSALAQIPEIAALEGLSQDYVAKLMRVLRQGGLVTSIRGAAGGYRLARPADQITMQHAIDVLDGPMFPDAFCQTHAGQSARCIHSSTDCSIRGLWRRVGGALSGVLGQITLAEIAGLPRAPRPRPDTAPEGQPHPALYPLENGA